MTTNFEDMELKNYRHYVLSGMVFAAFIALIAVPDESLGMAEWLALLAASKAAAFALGYAAYRLLIKWEKEGKIRIEDF